MTKNSTFIKKPQNRPIWHGKISRPSQEMLCFPSITRFICICSVFQTLGWCFMSSSFSAPVLEHPLADPSEQALISPPMPHYPCPTREQGDIMPGSLQWGGGLCPCFTTSALAKLVLGRDCKPVMDELRRCCCQKLVICVTEALLCPRECADDSEHLWGQCCCASFHWSVCVCVVSSFTLSILQFA